MNFIHHAGAGAWVAIAFGLLGRLLGVAALIAVLRRHRAAFSMVVMTLVLGALAAIAGMSGTLYGRYQTAILLVFVGTGVTGEQVLRAGFHEAQSASQVGFFAALVPLLLGGLGVLLGSRMPVVSIPQSTRRTLAAAILACVTALAWGGAWTMGFSPLPKAHYDFLDDDHDSWSLAAALEDVSTDRTDACAHLETALGRFWGTSDTREWPRRMRREVPPPLTEWRKAADTCATRALETFDEVPEARDQLLDSALLQDDGLRTRALKWAKAPSDERQMTR